MSDHTVSGQALAAGTSPNVSGQALAAGTSPPTDDPIRLFVTWTTYGTWLPGDDRGWRKWKSGQQQPQPLLEDWCRDQMKEQPLFLNLRQRSAVENVIREHAAIRGWELAAVSARSNHVHVAVTVVPTVSGQALAAGTSPPVSGQALAAGTSPHVSGQAPVVGKCVKNVRDQLKANATRILRQLSDPVTHEKIWTKGGDIQFIDSDNDWEQVILYITVAQDRMERGK